MLHESAIELFLWGYSLLKTINPVLNVPCLSPKLDFTELLLFCECEVSCENEAGKEKTLDCRQVSRHGTRTVMIVGNS
jgi:hypothetical protein